ncbi:MAG: DUF6456 domain-containing protein [Hyphomicrobiales bacterium]|jgi:hypothetical protein
MSERSARSAAHNLPTQPMDLQRALKAIGQKRSVPKRQFEWLKSQGFIGGRSEKPVLTAKGQMIADANISLTRGEESSADDTFHLPDAMDRLARPRNGEDPLIDPCDLAAARKFQGDLQRAGLRQRITQSWSLASLSQGGSKSAGGSPTRHEPVSMLDARERVNRACASIGPEFSGPLIDICLFEKSLTSVEKERQWPARSAKLVIALGLRALARHYGLTRTATGAMASKS